MYDWIFEHANNISSIFSSNCEASASELLENLEKISPCNIYLVSEWLMNIQFLLWKLLIITYSETISGYISSWNVAQCKL